MESLITTMIRNDRFGLHTDRVVTFPASAGLGLYLTFMVGDGLVERESTHPYETHLAAIRELEQQGRVRGETRSKY